MYIGQWVRVGKFTIKYKHSTSRGRQCNSEHSTFRVLAVYYVHHLAYDFGVLSCHVLVFVNIYREVVEMWCATLYHQFPVA